MFIVASNDLLLEGGGGDIDQLELTLKTAHICVLLECSAFNVGISVKKIKVAAMYDTCSRYK